MFVKKLLGSFWWSVRFMSAQLAVADLDFQYFSGIFSCLLSLFLHVSRLFFLKKRIILPSRPSLFFLLQVKCLIYHLKNNSIFLNSFPVLLEIIMYYFFYISGNYWATLSYNSSLYCGSYRLIQVIYFALA